MTLLIVDMQPDFRASYDCLHDVIKACKKARKENRVILALEYDGCGDTHERILDLLCDYEKFAIAVKYNDDGGREALGSFLELGADLHTIQVCGVNSCFCVADTVKTLAEQLPESEIIANVDELACTCWGGEEPHGCAEMVYANIRNGRKKGLIRNAA